MTVSKRFPWRLFSRVVAMQTVLVLIALAGSGLAARYFFKRQFLSQVEKQLHQSLGSLSRDLNAGIAPEWCSRHSYDAHFRLTLISTDGEIVCDSHHDSKTMENHLQRPEVQAALSGGFGHGIRFSETLSEEMLYGALLVPGHGVVIRGALPLSDLNRTLRVFDASLAVVLVGMAFVLAIFAVWFGRKLAFPVGRLLLKAQAMGETEPGPLQLSREESYGELSDLESSLEGIRRDLIVKAESLEREREEQATLMGAISDAILAVDQEGCPLFYNSRFAVLFGMPKEEHARLRLWEIIRDPEVLAAYRMALNEGKAGSVKALRLDQASIHRYVSLAVSPLRRVGGEVYGAVGVFHDVSELKHAEQVRIDFVANVSHELRTPLTAIKGYADTLKQDLREGKSVSPEFVEVICRNTERLLALMNDLLDLSSLESGLDQFHRSGTDTREITERVMTQLKGGFEAKKQKTEVVVNVDRILADPVRLEQVLVNLVDNASKYTPTGGTIGVVWDRDEAGKRTLLKVTDTGPGIASEHHGRLFERFYRVDRARSRQLGGTGLGLAIVKHIMQRHGGQVWVESELGHGSQFICAFPDPESF